MHEVLHVGILVTTISGVAGLALLLVWPLVAETPLPAGTARVLLGLVGLAIVLFLVEWRLVH